MEPLLGYDDLPVVTGAPGSKLLCVLYSQNRLLVQDIATSTVWTQPFDYPAPDTEVPVPSAHGVHGPLPVELDNNGNYTQSFYEMPGTNKVILLSTSKQSKSTVQVVDLATGHQRPVSFVDPWEDFVVCSVSEDLVYGYLNGYREHAEIECTRMVLDMTTRRSLPISAGASHGLFSPGVLLPHRAGLATIDPRTDYVEIVGFSSTTPIKRLPLIDMPIYICSPRVRDGSFLVVFNSSEESRCARYTSFTADAVGATLEMSMKCNELPSGLFQITESGYGILTRDFNPPRIICELPDSLRVPQT